ncbi:DUF2780 domain-containing protein [Roseibium aggregatum]|uniref:DUF2780 domain-containing protein n=1 Tax=Roseibium aggregatum TaxID=187304 RepID=A0A939EDX3_9HYPH|nr:DUF2780 domain-containing protein [Roseibium aggregatum]MBN9671178.1 DUF2780 domain-containing protein [Roseibium aggregatum]
MNELINRIMTSAGIDEDLAKKAVGIILGFLNKEAPDDKMRQIFDALPGTEDLVAEREAAGAGGGFLSRMGGTMGAMAALNELTSAGLSMNGVQSVAKELVAYAKETAGDEVVDEVISKIPGLSQLI